MLAEWWFLLSSSAEYEEEANLYYQAMLELCDEHPQILLELGSSGFNHFSGAVVQPKRTLYGQIFQIP